MLNDFIPYLPGLLVVLLMVRRTQRSRRVRPNLMWIGPAILFALGVLYTVGAVQKGLPLTSMDALIIVGAAATGIALGAVRANTIHLTRHPETGDIESKLSIWGLIVILAWLFGRNILHRFGVQSATTVFGVYNDSMIALAFASVTARAFVLFRRCAGLKPILVTESSASHLANNS